ncbi:hypothetical protein [Nocardioides montaniterrae]
MIFFALLLAVVLAGILRTVLAVRLDRGTRPPASHAADSMFTPPSAWR